LQWSLVLPNHRKEPKRLSAAACRFAAIGAILIVSNAIEVIYQLAQKQEIVGYCE